RAKSSRTCSRSSPSVTWGTSLRRNSSRECSRRARRRMARARSVGSGFRGRGLTEGLIARNAQAMRGCESLALVRFGGFGRRGHSAGDPDRFPDLRFDLLGHGRVVLQEFARVVLALPDLLALVGVPGAGLLDDAMQHPELDDLAFARNALVVQDVEIRGLEGG